MNNIYEHNNKWFVSFIMLLMIMLLASCAIKDYSRSTSKPVTHEVFTGVLHKFVDEQGWVDYASLQKDDTALNTYLDQLRHVHPNAKNWNDNEAKAYWINAYNAFTLRLILDHYPTESIKDIKSGIPFINSVWDISFIEIEGRSYSLNDIEHRILRPNFKDPRIHFAINCASVSCPVLRREAYEANRLEDQLNEQARLFINDPLRNQIEAGSVKISRIFKWFNGDFTRETDLSTFINQYSNRKIPKGADLEYLPYDWRLNSIDRR
jgi:hypothetical protein